MTRHTMRWAVPALVGLASFGLVGLPVLAQITGNPPTIEVNRAKEMAALIEQGQLNLRDATTLAEKHAKGTALEAMCTIEPAEPQMQPTAPPRPGAETPGPQRPPGERPPAGPSVQKEQPGGRRLVYDVSCFVKDRVETIHVDGLTKKVIEPLMLEHK